MQELAGTIGERNVFHPQALEDAARYISRDLDASGFQPSSQPFTALGREVRNIEAELTGTERADEIVVLGAHYDSVEGCPGANDNGSGVAALLEVARALKALRLERTVRFVAFVNEEPPFFQGPQMGSLVSARRSRARGERIVGMLSLETIGYYTNEPKTQQYPAPLGLLYPSTGNFIGMVGNVRSRQLLTRVATAFRAATAVSHPVRRRARLTPGCRLVRSLGLLAGGLSRHHAHRHRPISLSPLPYGARYA